jgi:hypothetical protein
MNRKEVRLTTIPEIAMQPGAGTSLHVITFMATPVPADFHPEWYW